MTHFVQVYKCTAAIAVREELILHCDAVTVLFNNYRWKKKNRITTFVTSQLKCIKFKENLKAFNGNQTHTARAAGPSTQGTLTTDTAPNKGCSNSA